MEINECRPEDESTGYKVKGRCPEMGQVIEGL
jgi:hypothetical protein